MRILQVNKLYYPWIGGIETVARDIAEHFNVKQGCSVANLVCQPRGKRTFEEVGGVPTYRSGSWGILWGMPLSFDFFRLFRKLAGETDMIILHHPFPLAFVAYRFFGRNKKVVVWYHSDIVKQKLVKVPFMPFIKFALRRAECIFVSNRAIIKTSSVIAPFSSKCRVAYFGIDPKRFRETKAVRKHAEEIRAKYGMPLILAVGRLVYYKGYSYLIDAMKEVSAHLLIVGNGPLRRALDEQIAEHGLRGKISILDPVSDLIPYYYACDVFALPSTEPSEVFGIVQIEALACGKPVVNTSLPTGVPEVSVDGVTGRTVPPKDTAAFAAALREILSEKKEYRSFSKNAITAVDQRFTKEKFFSEMEKYIASSGGF
jgi:glycosyltransferase involved in cell wall biosynthesis